MELVLVTATLAVLSFLLIPADSLSLFNLRTAADRIEQDIRYVQDLATTTGSNCGLSFTMNGNYLGYQQTVANVLTDPLTLQPYNIDIAQAFRGVRLLNTIQVEFDALGRPVTGANQGIQIGNGLSVVTLVVTPNTGVVQRQ